MIQCPLGPNLIEFSANPPRNPSKSPEISAHGQDWRVPAGAVGASLRRPSDQISSKKQGDTHRPTPRNGGDSVRSDVGSKEEAIATQRDHEIAAHLNPQEVCDP